MPAGRPAVLQRYYRVWQRGNVAALDDLLTSDYIDHDPLPGFGADRASAKAMAAHVTAAMTDVRLAIHHLITDGDLGAAHWTMTFLPAAGQDQARIQVRGHDFFRLRGNRICEIWHCESRRPPPP